MKSKQRKQGRPRHNRPRVDHGTFELQQKRKKLLEKGLHQDAFLMESLLGILYSYAIISKPLYEAGQVFGELGYRFEPCLGHTFRHRISILCLIKGRSLEDALFFDKIDAKQTNLWRKSLEVLNRAGPRPYEMVHKVVFYDQDIYVNGLPSFLVKGVKPLRQGLAYLDLYFKEGLKDGPGTPPDSVLSP